MDIDDAPLLHEPDLMLAVLRVAAQRSGTLDACIDHLRTLRDCAKVDERVPEEQVRARLKAVMAKLDRASLIERPAANGYRITARGRQVLAEHPDGVDESVLMQFEEFRAATARHGTPSEMPERTPSEYDAGYLAFGEGRGLADNPHPADARAHLDWQNGWSQARDDAARRRG